MPSKNTIKQYVENGYYHIYNRGVEKRTIFKDTQDCEVLLHYLKMYLSPVEELRELAKQQQYPGTRLQRFLPLNLSKEINLLSFSLMPNHIHLQIKQHTKEGIIKFMRRILTSYAVYFNKKYERVGALFQSKYKAAIIASDEYLLHLSRYIHLNPIKLGSLPINFVDFSSYPYYLGKKQASWVKPQEILSYFKSAQRQSLKDIFSYQSFVEDYLEDSREVLGGLTLEDEF